jgi:hypothetical protein
MIDILPVELILIISDFLNIKHNYYLLRTNKYINDCIGKLSDIVISRFERVSYHQIYKIFKSLIFHNSTQFYEIFNKYELFDTIISHDMGRYSIQVFNNDVFEYIINNARIIHHNTLLRDGVVNSNQYAISKILTIFNPSDDQIALSIRQAAINDDSNTIITIIESCYKKGRKLSKQLLRRFMSHDMYKKLFSDDDNYRRMIIDES